MRLPSSCLLVVAIGALAVACTSGPGLTEPPPTSPVVTREDPGGRPAATPAGPDLAGGIDGPVMFAPGPTPSGGELALISGTLVLDGECLYAGVSPAGRRSALLWRYGTRWDSTTKEVVFPEGDRVRVGAEFSAGGGVRSLNDTGGLLDGPGSRERAELCTEGEPQVLFYIQSSTESP